jgi:hypothetical protein
MPVNEDARKTVSVKFRFAKAVAEALKELAEKRGEERVAIVSRLILADYAKSTGAKKKERSGP